MVLSAPDIVPDSLAIQSGFEDVVGVSASDFLEKRERLFVVLCEKRLPPGLELPCDLEGVTSEKREYHSHTRQGFVSDHSLWWHSSRTQQAYFGRFMLDPR